MKPTVNRERIAAAILTLAGVALAIALAYNPRLPGPSELVDAMFRPAVVLIEQMSEKWS